jgi:hypothetical protein
MTRMTVRDAGWLPHDQIRVIGPLTGVTPATVRESLLALHRSDPGHPALCRLDRGGGRWVALRPGDFAALLDGAVTDGAVTDGAVTDGAVTDGAVTDGGATKLAGDAEAVRGALMAQEPDGRPLRVLVRGGFVGVRMSHAVGDGRVLNALLPHLLGVTVIEPLRRTRLPLARAAARWYGADPRRLRTMLTVPRPVLPGFPPGAPVRPWCPDPCSHYARSRDDLLPEVRAWRDRHLPGVSVAAVLFAATRAAFEECGLAPGHPGLMIQVDARRYLPPAAVVRGNFTAAQYVEPADARDPRAVHEALGAAIAAGRPLTTLALRHLRALCDLRAARPGRRTAARPDTVRVDPLPVLTMTHHGRLDYGGLPWACPPGDRVLMSAPTTDGADGVTVSYLELAGALHVNVAYHRSTFDETAMRRVADLLCADPTGLVGRPRQPASSAGRA